jgi:hypothetical protein
MHPLKDPWFLSFVPNITIQMVQKEYNNDWNAAQQRLLKPIDTIRSIEELWSTFNSLPKISSLPIGDTIILARNAKDPSFESFPEGKRIQICVYTQAASEKAIDIVLATVIGEQVREYCEGENDCDVIKFAHKPNQQSRDCVKIEIWLNSPRFLPATLEFIRNQFKEKGITNADLKETTMSEGTVRASKE